MRSKLFILLLAGFACSCASSPFIGSVSAQAARREARRDIETKHLKLYLAGTRGTHEVGVAENERALVAALPRSRSLPTGCTDPRASEAVEYARAYNQEMVRYLSGSTSHLTSPNVP